MKKTLLMVAALLSSPAMAFDLSDVACRTSQDRMLNSQGNTTACFDARAVYNLSAHPVKIETAAGQLFILRSSFHSNIEDYERPFEITVLGPVVYSQIIDSNEDLFIIESFDDDIGIKA